MIAVTLECPSISQKSSSGMQIQVRDAVKRILKNPDKFSDEKLQKIMKKFMNTTPYKKKDEKKVTLSKIITYLNSLDDKYGIRQSEKFVSN